MVLGVAISPQAVAAGAVKRQTGRVHEDQRQIAKQIAAALEQTLLEKVLDAARRQRAGSGGGDLLAEPRHCPVGHTGDGRTEASGHKARGRKPKPPAAVRDARGRFMRTPRELEALAEEVDRQPPDHADNSRPTSKPAGTDEGPEAVAELFDDFLVFALAESDLWDVIASALPEELFDRIDRHVEALLAVPWEQGR